MNNELDPLERLSLQATLSAMAETLAQLQARINMMDARVLMIQNAVDKISEKLGVNDGSADFPPN